MFDISSEIAIIEKEINSGDDAKESEFRKMRAVVSKNTAILLGLRFGTDSDVEAKLLENEAVLREVDDRYSITRQHFY